MVCLLLLLVEFEDSRAQVRVSEMGWDGMGANKTVVPGAVVEVLGCRPGKGQAVEVECRVSMAISGQGGGGGSVRNIFNDVRMAARGGRFN